MSGVSVPMKMWKQNTRRSGFIRDCQIVHTYCYQCNLTKSFVSFHLIAISVMVRAGLVHSASSVSRHTLAENVNHLTCLLVWDKVFTKQPPKLVIDVVACQIRSAQVLDNGQ